MLLESTEQDYPVDGGMLRVLGLSDVGQAIDEENGIFYDDCYSEDRDNYIDIILSGIWMRRGVLRTLRSHRLKAVIGPSTTPVALDQNPLRESDIPSQAPLI